MPHPLRRTRQGADGSGKGGANIVSTHESDARVTGGDGVGGLYFGADNITLWKGNAWERNRETFVGGRAMEKRALGRKSRHCGT